MSCATNIVVGDCGGPPFGELGWGSADLIIVTGLAIGGGGGGGYIDVGKPGLELPPPPLPALEE